MRFGVREICDVVFKARTEMKIGNKTFKKGQPVLYIDTAKTSTLEGAASTVYAQGGKGNPRLVAWEGERTVTFTVEDALISPISFALLTGAGLGNMADADSQNKIKVHTTFDLPILDGGIVKIDLDTAGDNHDIVIDDDTPVFGMILDNAGAGVVPCNILTEGITGPKGNTTDGSTVYTITKDVPLTLKFSDADKYVGKTLRVDCYAQKTGGATEITIDAENFAGNYYVEASTLFREQHSALDMPAEIVIPNVKIQSNFTFSMAASGDPSTFTFTMDAFPDYTQFDKQHKVFAAIQIIGEENIHPDVVDEEEATGDVELKYDVVVDAGGTSWVGATNFAGKDIATTKFGNNLKASIDGANIDFYGNLNRIDNWSEFSSKPGDLTGYYYPFHIEVEDSDDPSAVVWMYRKDTLGGEGPKWVPVNSTNMPLDTDGSAAGDMIMAINPNKPVFTVYFQTGTTAKPTFDEATAVEYSLDFSKVVFK